MKKILLTVAASLMLTSTGMAFSLPTSTEVELKYKNWEVLVDNDQSGQISVGDGLWGLIRLTTIDTLGGQNLWSQGVSSGEEITGKFYDLTVSQIIPTGTGLIDIRFTGGKLDLFLDSTPEYSNPTVTATNFLDGTPFLSGNFNYGIIPGDTTVTQDATVNGLTAPLSGTGFFYLDVTGGDYAALFNSDALTVFDGSKRDIFARSNISAPSTAFPDFTYVSDDPARATTVPEPSTFVLFGAGLLGAGFLARRRNK